MVNRVDKDIRKTERLLELYHILVDARTNIPLSRFSDPEKWGTARTFKRLCNTLNEGWVRLRGTPLFEVVNENGNRVTKGERYMKVVDHSIIKEQDSRSGLKLIALLASIKFLSPLKKTLLEEEIATIKGQFKKSLTVKEKHLFQFADRKFFYFGKGLKDYSEKRDIFDDIYDALIYDLKLEVDYKNRNDNTKTYLLKPLCLTLFNGGLYLVALPEEYDDTANAKIFRIEGILRAALKRQMPFKYPANFHPEAFFAGQFGFIHSNDKKIYKVELIFSADAKVQSYVKERRWTDNDRIDLLADGRMRLRFAISELTEVMSFALGFGEHVEVVSPAELRQEITERVKKMMHIYHRNPSAA